MSSRPPPPVIATRVPSSYPLYLTSNRFRRGPLPVTVVGPDGTNVPVASRDTYYSGQHEPFYPTATADHPNAYSGAYSAYNTYSGAYGPPASGNGDYIQSAFPLEVYFPSVLFTQNDRPRARLKSSRSYDHDTRMLEGCGRVVKYSLFVANLVIMLGGMVVFSVGAWTLADRSFMERLLGTDLYVSSAAILIATGCIVTFVSLLGCLGAFKEIKCMLLTFFVILFMLFIVMMVGGILGYVFRNEVDERMYQEMLMSIPIYKNDSVVTKAWDAVQRHVIHTNNNPRALLS
ncbi:uncharacterized protein LOC111262833 isoform X2 [Varroa jacobsoni]|uniref:uncharacterized protein LOC111262833 isoform X2 n=1 Tax=Varroa jacobsoni TaxID=62625 RepID=UPI000BF334EF|nr:uncharacterized protein LOC111262833 isoform X2 [Varroa jacobsoni]